MLYGEYLYSIRIVEEAIDRLQTDVESGVISKMFYVEHRDGIRALIELLILGYPIDGKHYDEIFQLIHNLQTVMDTIESLYQSK